MDVTLVSTPRSQWHDLQADALIVVLAADKDAKGADGMNKPSRGGKAVQPATPELGNADLQAALALALRSGEFSLKAGQTHLALRATGTQPQRWVFSVAASGEGAQLYKAVQAAVGLLKSGPSQKLALLPAEGTSWDAGQMRLLTRAVVEAAYAYRSTKPSAPNASSISQIQVWTDRAVGAQRKALQTGLQQGLAVAEGVNLARECANLPANHCTPTHLAARAKAMAKPLGLKVQVLDKTQCAKLGMGSFLAVAQGSAQAPQFIVLQHQGGGAKQAPIVLVGKGVTFDTGGISLKPPAEMDEMKFDMGGAASVLGTLQAVAQMKLPLNVVALIPATENMPSGTAVKPGDVVTSMSGQTIEILNTDAEGRLILCDALSYAKRFKPQAIVDVATLTGACVIALGHHRSGLFVKDDTLADALLKAGEVSADLAWRMPLDEAYAEGLKSNFADMANVAGRPAGAITAAKFLERFAGEQPWAHLDIAGTAWKSGAAKGATGRPVPLLAQFLMDQAQATPASKGR